MASGAAVVGLFLVAQVVIASFDLTVLGRVLDYLLTTVLVGLLVIFQPELRRGLMVLGQYQILRYFSDDHRHPVADRLADAAEVIRPNPVTLQLRYLQALSEISSNQASTIVFPLPLDLLKPLVDGDRDK